MEIVRVYQSLFDEIDFQTCAQNKRCLNSCNRDCDQFQYYEGDIASVFHDLNQTLSEAVNDKFDLSQPEKRPLAGKLITEPSLIIRAMLDYKIENPDDNFIDSFFDDALTLGLNIYQRNPGSADYLNRFRQDILSLMGQDFLLRRVSQRTDKWTWKSGNPNLSEGSAKYLNSILKSKDILFIALAHGGVAAGMDVFLRYRDIAGCKDSQFYACRFSRGKCKDQLPRLNDEDIEYLQTMGEQRQVVIFDEDVASEDGTLSKAKDFFEGKVFSDQYVFAIANQCLY